MPKDLRTFLRQVQEMLPDDYVHVEREVDPEFELTGVLRKLQEQNRFPTVLFEHVRGTRLPVIGNLLASRKRLALAFDTTDEGLTEEYVRRQERTLDPVMVDDAPVHDVVITREDVDLRYIPNIVHCEGDAGPYISSGMCIAKDADSGVRNMGIYRVQIAGPRKLRYYPGEYSHMEHLRKKRDERDQPLEVAIVIGHHPGVYMASQYRGPMGVDELAVAGGLLGEPLRMTKCKTIDVEVPADAEIVIEGRTQPHVKEWEGPFGEFTWYLGPAEMNPVIEVTAITHRRDAIYQDMFNAHPEHNLTGLIGREAGLYRAVKNVAPTLKALTLPYSGCCRHAAYISIKKLYDGVAKNCALAALAADPFLKLAIVVDEDIDVFDETQVMWAVATRVQADRDVFVIPDAYVCELDPSAYDVADRSKRGYLNAKWSIDATKPVGIPFQERSDVPESAWKHMNLEDYIVTGARSRVEDLAARR
ncbi:MAG TPA: UbiD family decarboxylase [Chloroflexota bacterium]